MTGCELCGVGPEDDCAMDCLSRQRWDPGDAAKILPNVAAALRERRAYRDFLIRRARADGESVAGIAAAVGMTGPGVRRVLARN